MNINEMRQNIGLLENQKKDAMKELNSISYEIKNCEDTAEIKTLQAASEEMILKVKEYDKDIYTSKKELEEATNKLNEAKNQNQKHMATEGEPLKDMLNSEVYLKAYVEALKKGDVNFTECKNLTKAWTTAETASTGITNAGVFIPEYVNTVVSAAFRTGGQIATLCDSQTFAGVYSTIFEVEMDDAIISDENPSTSIAEENGILEKILFNPKTINKLVKVTVEQEALSSKEFIDYLTNEMMDKMLRKLDANILLGAQGTEGIKGILTNTDTDKVVPLDMKAEVTFQKMLEMIGAVDNGVENGAVYIMNRQTYYTNIQGMPNLDGSPTYMQASDKDSNPKPLLNGYPVIFTNSLKSFDDAIETDKVIVFGNLKGYLLNYPAGKTVDMQRDPYSGSGQNLVHYRGRLIVAGDVTKYKAFSYFTKGTTV